MGDRSRSVAAYQMALVMRPIINDLADEIASAERGKSTTRLARKINAAAEAVNRLVAVALPPETGPA